jgi:hypothetical protein
MVSWRPRTPTQRKRTIKTTSERRTGHVTESRRNRGQDGTFTNFSTIGTGEFPVCPRPSSLHRAAAQKSLAGAGRRETNLRPSAAMRTSRHNREALWSAPVAVRHIRQRRFHDFVVFTSASRPTRNRHGWGIQFTLARTKVRRMCRPPSFPRPAISARVLPSGPALSQCPSCAP